MARMMGCDACVYQYFSMLVSTDLWKLGSIFIEDRLAANLFFGIMFL